jgi:hypothetical protein
MGIEYVRQKVAEALDSLHTAKSKAVGLYHALELLEQGRVWINSVPQNLQTELTSILEEGRKHMQEWDSNKLQASVDRMSREEMLGLGGRISAFHAEVQALLLRQGGRV